VNSDITKVEKEFSVLYRHLAESLDISDTHYRLANARYSAMGKWLERNESKIADMDPVIYPQGSFLLGTVVKAISDNDEYDLDLVCELRKLTKKDISQEDLKKSVGNEIKGYAQANNMSSGPKESKRCWTLEYSDQASFHMDLLPAIPEADFFKLSLIEAGIPRPWSDQTTAITDRTLPNYHEISPNWLRSNPRGYAEWFKDRMRVQHRNQREILAVAMNLKAENVPEYRVKTTLQRSVQILKRHRDIMFADDPQDKPISMIITTIAAHAYDNEEDLISALLSITENMAKYIQDRNGIYWVVNPVNPAENFADKWKRNPKQAQNFFRWIKQVNEDIRMPLEVRGIDKIAKPLEKTFGVKATKTAIEAMGHELSEKRESGALKMSFGTGTLGTLSGTIVKKHEFFGA
jgi:hypothetical protein